jgi:proteic killer suppression protein
MITSIAHRGLRRLIEKGETKHLQSTLLPRIRQILGLMNSSERLEDLGIPELHLHPLTGNLKGFWSVTVRANWRIIFQFDQGNFHNIDLVDYH